MEREKSERPKIAMENIGIKMRKIYLTNLEPNLVHVH